MFNEECKRFNCRVSEMSCAPCGCGGHLVVTNHRHADNSFKNFDSPNWIDESWAHSMISESIEHVSPEVALCLLS